MSSTGTLERPDVKPSHGDTTDDIEFRKHIVDERKYNVTEAIVMGTEVEALCGYRWIPSRDPNVYPPCEECHMVYASMFP